MIKATANGVLVSLLGEYEEELRKHLEAAQERVQHIEASLVQAIDDVECIKHLIESCQIVSMGIVRGSQQS